jgi:molybdenum cofactor cytidylyltransferase
VRIGCAILAAGAGVRFRGRASKLVARLDGKPLLQYAVDAACSSGALSCSLILGAEAEEVFASVDSRRCAVLMNAAWREGIASSVRCAAAAHAGDDALVVVLGDQPGVTAGDLDALMDVHRRDARAIVALRSADVWGAPMLFPRRDVPALLSLTGDLGAKRYADKHRSRVVFVDAVRPDAFADVDTEADLVRPPTGR